MPDLIFCQTTFYHLVTVSYLTPAYVLVRLKVDDLFLFKIIKRKLITPQNLTGE